MPISVVTGALIQVRNYVWTGDPFFPFLMPRLNPASMNSFALHSLVADTRSKGYSLHLAHILAFPITMALDGNRYGLGQYFGPLILAFGPLLFFARWKDPTAKLSGSDLGAGAAFECPHLANGAISSSSVHSRTCSGFFRAGRESLSADGKRRRMDASPHSSFSWGLPPLLRLSLRSGLPTRRVRARKQRSFSTKDGAGVPVCLHS